MGRGFVPAHREKPVGPRPTKVKSMTNFSSGRADSRSLFYGAAFPFLRSSSFRFPFLFSFFRAPAAKRWGGGTHGKRGSDL